MEINFGKRSKTEYKRDLKKRQGTKRKRGKVSTFEKGLMPLYTVKSLSGSYIKTYKCF